MPDPLASQPRLKPRDVGVTRKGGRVSDICEALFKCLTFPKEGYMLSKQLILFCWIMELINPNN